MVKICSPASAQSPSWLKSIQASNLAAALLAYARAMVYWHDRHRFCGDCGHPTVSASAGHERVCTNVACGRHHFPRTDPAIIVLVTLRERCLLGRQRVWPEGLHSTIAVPAALRAVRKGGVVVCAGIHMSDIPSFPYALLWGERILRSVANLTRRDGQEFFELAPRVPVRTEIETHPLEDAGLALERLRAGRVRGAAVLVVDGGP